MSSIPQLRPWIPLVALLAAGPLAAEEAPRAVMEIVPVLQGWGSDPVLVEAVRQQNARAVPLDEIKRLDAEWIAASTPIEPMARLQSNEAASELKRLEASEPFFTEVFLMDDQGALVAMTSRTSDYWQGDEAKFTESFKQGEGAVHVGDVDFDTSAQAYLVQVSVPVVDEGAAIGAITVGIDLDALDRAGR